MEVKQERQEKRKYECHIGTGRVDGVWSGLCNSTEVGEGG